MGQVNDAQEDDQTSDHTEQAEFQHARYRPTLENMTVWYTHCQQIILNFDENLQTCLTFQEVLLSIHKKNQGIDYIRLQLSGIFH